MSCSFGSKIVYYTAEKRLKTTNNGGKEREKKFILRKFVKKIKKISKKI